MSQYQSNDPRAVRTRQAFEGAFIALLQNKPFQKITVTDIAKKAGFARHTFYNHYETKEDIINALIDSVLEQFFSSIKNRNIFLGDPEQEYKMFTSFFKVWKDNLEIVDLLKKIDMDNFLIERLKNYFTKFYYEKVSKEIPKVNIELAKYVINFNAYTLLSILKPWIKDDMRYSPEIMAGFLSLLADPSQKKQAVEKYKDIFI